MNDMVLDVAELGDGNKAQNTSLDVFWAIGIFFFVFIRFISILTTLFECKYDYDRG